MRACTIVLLLVAATAGVASAQPRFAEGFEGSPGLPPGWTVWNNATFPIRPETNWAVRDTGITAPGIAIVTTKAHTGLRAAGISWWASTDTGGVPRIQADALLVTPRIPALQATESVRFWASGARGAFLDSLQVWLSPVDSTPAGIFGGTRLGTIIWPAGSPYGQFTEYEFSVQDAAGLSGFIGFRYFMNCTNAGFYVHLDDVRVEPTLDVSGEPEGLPAAADLLPNYPNPFNPATTLAFRLAQRTDVRLAVYDMLGRETALLADGVFEAGTHRVVWGARGMASGAYVARLAAGGVSASRMMLLTR
jgi:hypothetical protein